MPHIKRQCTRAVHILITINPDQRVPFLIERPLEADNNKLKGVTSLRTNVVGNFGYVGVVKRSIDFVQDKKRRWLVTCARSGSASKAASIKFTCEWQTKAQELQQFFRLQIIDPCLGTASLGASHDISHHLHKVPLKEMRKYVSKYE